MKKILFLMSITGCLFASNTDFFKYPVGKSFDQINSLNVFHIRIYKNLKAGIYEDLTKIESKRLNKVSQNLFKYSDSVNAPEAFIIDSYLYNNKKIEYKCLKKEKDKTIEKKDSCAIRRDISNPIITLRREHYELECVKIAY